MTHDTQSDAELVDAAFELLTTKYVQRADDRQREMGLQYTTAETHDLAKTIAAFVTRSLPQAGEPALCEHGHIDRMSGCNQCEAREIEGTDSPQAGEGVDEWLMSLIEPITKAVLFDDCGNTADWKDNTGIGIAAVNAIRPLLSALPLAGRVELLAEMFLDLWGKEPRGADTERAAAELRTALTGKVHP